MPRTGSNEFAPEFCPKKALQSWGQNTLPRAQHCPASELLYFCFLFADWVEKEARILFFHLRKQESDGSSKRRLFVA